MKSVAKFVAFIAYMVAILVGFLLVTNIHAEAIKKPEKVTLGIYITELYDLDLPSKSFNAVFWIWSFSEKTNFNLKDNIDIVNARDFHTDFFSKGQNSKGQYWQTTKYTANMVKNWDLTLFPFDKQILQIYLESILLQSHELVFIPDENDSGIDADIDLGDWKVVNVKLTPFEKVYNSLYDSKINVDSKYTRLVAEITIKRHGVRKFVQYLGVTYLACFLGFCIYFLPINALETRITLLIGAIFAAVGNKILLDGALPPVNTLTLVDKIEIMVFVFLCYTLVMTLITIALERHGKDRVAYNYNRYGFLAALLLMLLGSIVLLLPLLY